MAFDPYYHWLGIPPREQPPNHYRLLGIELFEPNDDVISCAADRQMAHLRAFQNSKQAADSQRLLNEVSAARVCLLSPDRRAAYDAELRAQLADRAAAAQSHPSHLTPPEHTPPHAYGPMAGGAFVSAPNPAFPPGPNATPNNAFPPALNAALNAAPNAAPNAAMDAGAIPGAPLVEYPASAEFPYSASSSTTGTYPPGGIAPNAAAPNPIAEFASPSMGPQPSVAQAGPDAVNAATAPPAGDTAYAATAAATAATAATAGMMATPSAAAPLSGTPASSATATPSGMPASSGASAASGTPASSGTPANRPIPRPVPQPASAAGGPQPFVVASSSRSARRRPTNAGLELVKIVAGGAFGCIVALAVLWFGFEVDPVGWHDHVDPKVLDDVSRKLGRQQVAKGRGNSGEERGNRNRSGVSGGGEASGADGKGAAGGADGGDQATGRADGMPVDGNASTGDTDSRTAQSKSANAAGRGGADPGPSAGSGGMSKFPTAKGRTTTVDGPDSSTNGSTGDATNGSTRRPIGAGSVGLGAGPGILARGTVAVPPMETRLAALKLLDDSYKVEAARTAAEKKACAEKLMAASKEGSVSDAERFALWQRTAALAADAGEAKLVQSAIEDMARTFDYDAGNAMEKMLVRAMDNIKDEATLDACIPVTQKTIFEFIVRDEVDAAMRLTDATYTLCLKAFGKKHRKFVFDGQALMRRLDQQWQRAREAREAIAGGAGTPTHQRELGRFLCVCNSQWEQGLPHLIQGDNETYAAAARLDLENPAENAARIAVADRWYDIAMANPVDEGFAARAIHWYSLAVGEATGLAKTKATTRLDELRRMLDELDKRELTAARILRGQFR